MTHFVLRVCPTEEKGAIKLHTLLDLRGSLPGFVHVAQERIPEVTVLDALVAEPGAVSVPDRGYLDFARLYTITEGLAFFVVRAKRRHNYGRCQSHQVGRTANLRSDQVIRLRGPKSAQRATRPPSGGSSAGTPSRARASLLGNPKSVCLQK